jgi:hypothetical protein
MTRWLVIPGVLACTVAGAEVAEYEPRMTLHPGEGVCFAVVSIDNISGVYNETERLETEHGPVSIRYETVGSHNATDHDLVDVVDLPAGVAANPMHLDLPDGETGYICLMEYLGG